MVCTPFPWTLSVPTLNLVQTMREERGERETDSSAVAQSVVLLSDASLKTPNETNCELRLSVVIVSKKVHIK